MASPTVLLDADLALPEALNGVPERAPATSLVPSSESLGEICPRRPLWVVCDQDPDLRFPASCDSYRCEKCGPRKARSKTALLTHGVRLAKRARFGTLTLVPDQWQTARGQMFDLRRRIIREGFNWEWGWAFERGDHTGMKHAHFLQHGDFVPQAHLQDLWGGRRVDIRAVRAPGAGEYVMKAAAQVAGYVGKGVVDHQAHLDLNGGRALHYSRGYLHGRTAVEAMREVASLMSEGQDRTWHLEQPARSLENPTNSVRPA